MVIARLSTALTIMVGPVLDADGVAVTDCVVGDFKISKNGAAPGALNGSATLTHRHTGHYSLALTTSDISVTGLSQVTLDDGVNACQMVPINVLHAQVYDSLVAGTEYLEVAGAAQKFNNTVSPAEFYERDGTTIQFTRTLATDPAAAPITGAS